jgi:GxxExxY protein
MKDAELTHAIIGAAIEVHRALGPGLLEAVYEECLAREMVVRGLSFERQKPVPIVYRDLRLECGYRLDFVVAGRVVVEIKAVEIVPAIIEPIMLTYLRLSGCQVGLVINFHSVVLKDGIRRYVWHYQPDETKDDVAAHTTQRDAANTAPKAR